ncbi:MAG TPA: hypothetical protein VK912_17265 [Longimicrobiales bacterium]|nr:hypothetical protein [Longimicrobiales bacterium]
MKPSRMTRMMAAACVVAGVGASPVHAQVPWESPQLLASSTQAGITLMYVDYGLRPDDGTGLLITYRPAAALRGPGFRIAGTLPQQSDLRLSGGVDLALPMFEPSATFPLDVAWTAGFGGAVGDYYSVGLPVGVAASRTFPGDNVWVHPYTSARVVLEGYFGPGHPDESFGLALAADAGLDISLHRSRVLILRAAMSFGDRRALAVGLQVSPRASPARTARR